MMTHHDIFFAEVEGLAAKFMVFINFLTVKCRESILDHIMFVFIHELMTRAPLPLSRKEMEMNL